MPTTEFMLRATLQDLTFIVSNVFMLIALPATSRWEGRLCLASYAPKGGFMRNSKGQTLIEAAIILPIVLLLVFAIIDYGRAMYTKNTLTNAASTGARTAAVTSSLVAEPVTALSSSNSATAKAIQNILADELDKDTYNSVTYELAIVDPAPPGAPVTGSAQAGNQVRITLSLPSFQMWTPFTNFVAGITNSTSQSGSITITAQSAMRYE